MLWFYRLLFLPALVVLAPAYLLRMRKRGGYGENFAHRFGAHPRLPKPQANRPRIWLQAVSVGEMLAVGPIIEGLHREGAEIYLTTTTSTGYRLAHERYRNWTSGIGYFPLDAWPCSAAAWKRISPSLVILTEGERWPEHMRQAAIRGVPVLCINARLSDRSFARLKKMRWAARLVLGGVGRVLPGSAEDEARLRELGVPPERVTTTGNIKLDVHISSLSAEERTELRRSLGLPGGLILLGSSTWPGEEEALIVALQRARAAGIACSLLLVPRHAERRQEIEAVLRTSGLRFHLRSRGNAPQLVDVSVADTTGELRRLTQLADVVFVGKSLAPHTEGQTPVEAAVLQKPILFGPGMSNFRPIARELMARGVARQVRNGEELANASIELLRNDLMRLEVARSAEGWRRQNSGAVERTLAVIRETISRL